jgi:hypothetical protein
MRSDGPDPGCFNVGPRLRLRIPPCESDRADYPTDALRKGLTLEYEGADLSEEGVGFGVPILKRSNLESVFPGSCYASFPDHDRRHVSVLYDMNLVERLSPRGSPLLKGRIANSFKEVAALLHRSYPPVRRALTGLSNVLRKSFGIKTVFERGKSAGIVAMQYAFDPESCAVEIAMDASGLRREGLAEIVIMNEQGASFFTEYADSDGHSLHAAEIGSWSPVGAEEAFFRDPRSGVRFCLRRPRGARLYRGRELVGDRLAWSGFGYILPPGTLEFRYRVFFGESP